MVRLALSSKHPARPTHSFSLVPVCPVLFESQQAHPHPAIVHDSCRGGEGNCFNGCPSTPPPNKSPTLSLPPAPCLARLIVPFSTPSPDWLMGFQTPLAA